MPSLNLDGKQTCKVEHKSLNFSNYCSVASLIFIIEIRRCNLSTLQRYYTIIFATFWLYRVCVCYECVNLNKTKQKTRPNQTKEKQNKIKPPQNTFKSIEIVYHNKAIYLVLEITPISSNPHSYHWKEFAIDFKERLLVVVSTMPSDILPFYSLILS